MTDMKSVPELADLQKSIHETLKQWHEPDSDSTPLDGLFLVRQAGAPGQDTPRQAANKLLLAALEGLALEHPADAELLRRRFLDELTIQAVGNAMNMSEATVYRRLPAALRRLAGILHSRETQARAEPPAGAAKPAGTPRLR
jgi:DNA-directed RNA polymerase specialized sigma24 family protein